MYQRFCDWYVENIFPIGVEIYGRVTGLFPFSVGEYMIVAGIILLLTALVWGIFFMCLRKRMKKKGNYAINKRHLVNYYKFCLVIVVVVVLVLMSNFVILYGCSPMEIGTRTGQKEYSVRELEILRNYLVENANTLSCQIERDAKGHALYRGDLQQEAKKAMRNLAKKNPRLGGYYPNVKPIQNSRIMSMTGYTGVYFSFSMEANYNNELYATIYPETFCHEYAHLKGYIFEDEANFWGYLACVESEDIFFQYSGYLSALDYVEWAYFERVGRDRYEEQIRLNELAEADSWVWLKEEVEEEIYYSDEHIADVAEKLSEVREVVHDTSLKFVGVEDGIASYDRVTELLLQYYDGVLY